ncbi:MAG: hypothetical protein ACQERD_01620 [Campylobacterota bacterium]
MQINKLSLKNTFWSLFIFVVLIFNYLIDLEFINYSVKLESFNITQNLILFATYFIYSIFIFVLIIKTANREKSSKIFAFFTKLLVTLNLIYVMMLAFNVTKSYVLEDYFISIQIENLNETLPIKVNSFSSLKSLIKDKKTIHYKYELEGSGHIFDKLKLNTNSFKEQIKNSLCETINTKELLKKDYTLIYEYISKSNKSLIKVKANKSDCGANIYDLEMLKVILNRQTNI